VISFGWCVLALAPLAVLVWGIWTWCDKGDHIKAEPCQRLALPLRAGIPRKHGGDEWPF